MTDLFNSPVLKVEQPSPELNYQITDPQGTLLAYGTQVMGNRPKTGLGRFFSTGSDRSRVVVQVSRPDGAPLFFVDRAEGQPSSALQPPCAIVTPDGQLIGRVEHNTAAFAASFLQADGMGITQAHRLVDAQGRPMCDITGEAIRVSGLSTERNLRGGRYSIFTDLQGTEIARVDGGADPYTLQINYQLPEPLRTLVIAAPLALDLMPGS
ncbi:MAG TPA: hypothetical protein VGP70_25865 [Actinomadura sp.]|jgi:hypothetical protein|nr:hypothetical protein [Actinomadura sp.]